MDAMILFTADFITGCSTGCDTVVHMQCIYMCVSSKCMDLYNVISTVQKLNFQQTFHFFKQLFGQKVHILLSSEKLNYGVI